MISKTEAYRKAELCENAQAFAAAGGSHDMAMMWEEYARRLREIAQTTPTPLPRGCRAWPGER